MIFYATVDFILYSKERVYRFFMTFGTSVTYGKAEQKLT